MTKPISEQFSELLYTGYIDNDNIDDTVTRTCESIVELDHIPAWFPLAGAPYYEEVGVDCRYDVYLSTCESPAKKIALYNPVVVDFDPMGFRVHDDLYIYQDVPGNSGVMSFSGGPQVLDCGGFFEDLDIAGRDIRISSEGWAINDFGSIAYQACQLYVGDFHLELTCLEKGLKNIVLEVPF